MIGRLLSLFSRDPLDRAARRYAETLPGQLARDYGASDRYTPDQLRLSAARAKLPPEFLAVGYAAFLDHAISPTMPMMLPLSELLFRWLVAWVYRRLRKASKMKEY